MVSVIFLLLSIGYLWVGLAGDKAGDKKNLMIEALGFFGALWGLRALIVPSSITIFPTIVDFAILFLFCVLFMLVLRRLVE